MLNAKYLRPEFVAALQKSWDERAIWPGCKDGYQPGVSHPSYGQCLVGTLATWQAHNGAHGSFGIVPGVLEGDNMPDGGVWHFQLNLQENGLVVPVDVTWDQVENGIFTPARELGGSELHREIALGSFPHDDSLIPRLNVILHNLAAQEQRIDKPVRHLVAQAYDSLLFEM